MAENPDTAATALEPALDRIARRMMQLAADDHLAPARRRVMSVAQAGEYLSLHPQTVRGLIDGGEIKARRYGRRVLVEVEALDEWVANLPGAA